MTNQATSDRIEGDLQQRLQVVGIDPTLILTVVETILGLLSSCRNKQAAREGMQAPTFRERVIVRRELQRDLREHGQAVTRSQLDTLTDQVLRTAREAQQADRDALLDYATEYATI